MKVNWTKEQQEVIDKRNSNILVSAAAGSGKTAVLVERIIQKLMDSENPFDVDRLLVVTFTEAAAAEMKERIRDAIENKLEEEPDNEHLQRQSILIHSAKIMTIHSFCLSVIRDYFHTIDLDPGFRTGEEGELELLRQDVLEEILETHYEEGSQAFCDFIESFATGRDDKQIEEIILRAYAFSCSYPSQVKWLEECLSVYHTDGNWEEQEYVQRAKALVAQYLSDSLLLLQDGIAICEEESGPVPYIEALRDDVQQLEDMQKIQHFWELGECVCNIKWKTLSRISAKKVEQEGYCEEKIEQVKGIRQTVKDMLKELKLGYFADDYEQTQMDMKFCQPMAGVLVQLVCEFTEKFTEKKRSKNLIDFNDMEHLALQILTREEGERLVATQVAIDYREELDEIMIDEYQDSNLLQEAILTSVSKMEQGEYNIFMVGDVKQSIYRFRLARPELFMEKFDTYPKKEQCTRIDLHKNFRSRREVLDTVNVIFGRIMAKQLGGIDYDEGAKLHEGATYEEQAGVQSEAILVHMDAFKEEQDKLEYTQREFEAKAAVKRIKELLRTQYVLDKQTGKYRLAKYRDIVILTRSLKGWTSVFAEILQAEGIPTYTSNREGYFETLEIGVLLNYLKILDNKRQDLPLASVLTSPFVGLSNEELAMLQINEPKKAFHEAVVCYIQEGEDTVLKDKLVVFWEQLEHYREMLPYTAIHTLLWKIIHETGYGEYMAAYPGGNQRKANMEMLVEKALAYESTSYKGLFHFVRYIEQLKKYEVDYGEANIIDEQADAVRLMSIHKSKGLEFPIVIVAGMGKPFNTQDTKSKVVLHPTLGIGMQAIDAKMRTKSEPLYRKVIQQETKLENAGEELRVLYVALTRAKEKLILLGTITKWEKKQLEFQIHARREQDVLPFSYLAKRTNYYDWVLAAIGGREDAPELELRHFTMEELLKEEVVSTIEDTIDKAKFLTWDTTITYDKELKERIGYQFSYEYPHAKEQQFKRKYTVSELKQLGGLPEEIGEELYAQPEIVPLIPKFIAQEEMLSGASRGNAYHKVMELLDFTKNYTHVELTEALQGFISLGKIAQEEYDCIIQEDILSFLHSDIGKRMQKASQQQLFYKEQPFVIRAQEGYLVQGIIDAYFVEDDQIVVVDYKTDKVSAGSQLRERYQVQLDYYAQALTKLLKKEVKAKVIYGFTIRKEVVL
jgi:helicase-exonuclease AddAB, AddA subunit, Firmicutes type